MYSYHSATVESDSGKKLSDGVIISFAFDQMSIHLNNTDEIKINETLIINIFTKTNGCIIYKGIAKALYNNALTIDCVIFIEEKQRRKVPQYPALSHRILPTSQPRGGGL